MPPKCRTPDDYSLWFNHSWLDPTTRDIFKACDGSCLRSCTRMQYEWTDMSGRSTSGDPDARNLTDIWEEAMPRSFYITLDTSKPTFKVIEQQFAYDSHQLLGELGGTWGLFLGLSLLDILRLFERIILALL